MKCLAVISDDTYARLRALLVRELVPRLANVEEALSVMASSAGGQLIIDPCNLRVDTFASLIEAAVRSGMRVIIYAPLNPMSVARILEHKTIAGIEVIFSTLEEDATTVRYALNGGITMRSLLFDRIRDRLESLVPVIRTPIVGLFGGARIPRSVDTFSRELLVDPSTAREWMRRAGMRPLVDLFAALRLCSAWTPLTDRAFTMDSVALRNGFGSARSLSASCRRFTSLAPRRAATRLSAEEFAARIANRLRL